MPLPDTETTDHAAAPTGTSEGGQSRPEIVIQGPILPRVLLSRRDLTTTEKIVFSYMADRVRYFAGRGSPYYESVYEIASAVGLSPRGVQNALRGRKGQKGLVARGFLRVRPRRGFSHTWTVGSGDSAPAVEKVRRRRVDPADLALFDAWGVRNRRELGRRLVELAEAARVLPFARPRKGRRLCHGATVRLVLALSVQPERWQEAVRYFEHDDGKNPDPDRGWRGWADTWAAFERQLENVLFQMSSGDVRRDVPPAQVAGVTQTFTEEDAEQPRHKLPPRESRINPSGGIDYRASAPPRERRGAGSSFTNGHEEQAGEEDVTLADYCEKRGVKSVSELLPRATHDNVSSVAQAGGAR